MMPKLVLRLLESLIWDLLLIKEPLLGLGQEHDSQVENVLDVV